MKGSKLQRWTDVLVALLRHQLGATFTDLSRDVPAYLLPDDASELRKATVKRMFERDKAELLAFGVPIETVRHDGEIEKYRLRAAQFYLPYLGIVEGSGRERPPRRVDRNGYHSVQHLAFEPDELAAISAAAARVQKLGDPLLAEHARSAARKLAFDVPGFHEAGRDEVIVRADRLDIALFPVLHEALLGRKRLTFTYRSMDGDTTARRTVEPFGLFFLDSHWYLAARDAGADGEPSLGDVKNFRVSRMGDAVMNTARSQTADFAIPASFTLREHARSRLAWELGDADAERAVVAFRASTGAASPWLRLGSAVDGAPDRRAFAVKRPDRFVRWLLSLGGAAEPVSPPAMRDAYLRELRDVLALYGGAS